MRRIIKNRTEGRNWRRKGKITAKINRRGRRKRGPKKPRKD